MKLFDLKYWIIVLILGTGQNARSQFLENFDGSQGARQETPHGWDYATGDGHAKMNFIQSEGYASILVDATRDRRNIWWALIKVEVPGLNIAQLTNSDYELRVEARIRTSHAPRRVNLHFNHQRTTDFHSHLMEYDIPQAWEWHKISMTTHDFEVQTGDRINAQMALMDWGNGIYRVDVDYFKVDVVHRDHISSDIGEPIAYHPPLEDPSSYVYNLPVIEDAIIDSEFPDMNFNDWKDMSPQEPQILATGGSQMIILRWDLEEYQGSRVTRSGLLSLVTHALQRSPKYHKDFGMVRICEILRGDPSWKQSEVTYDLFRRARPIQNVINTQMIIDSEVSPEEGAVNLFTLSRPVLQRLVDGKTIGLAILPLGAVNATFKAMEYDEGNSSPRLYLDLER